jgi:hypothetical protein
LVIDQRQLFADEAIEKGGFAHIRAAHNSESEGHEYNSIGSETIE